MTATRIDPDELLPSNPDGKATAVPEFYNRVIAAINEHADKIDNGIAAVDVASFGAVGDGVFNDTAAIQAALDTGRTVVGVSGHTYLVDGGLTIDTEKQLFDLTGCKVKLKAGASEHTVLTLNKTGSRVVGGEFDMNAANNASGDPFGHVAVLLAADYTSVDNVYVHDSFGIGIRGTGAHSYNSVKGCRVENCAASGIFFDGPSTHDTYGTRIEDCTVVMAATSNAVGIYVVSVSPYTYVARRFHIANNTVIGPSSASSSTVGITGRGNDGIITGNHVVNFDLGISVDRSVSTRCVVSNNRVENSYAGYSGIEVNGADCVISGNYVRGSQYGIAGSTSNGGGESLDGRVITGNRLHDQVTAAIYVAPLSGDTARRQLIVGNVIATSTMQNGLIRLSLDCQYSLIEGNILKGTGSGVSGGRGVFLDTVPGNISIRGNRFAALERAVSLFNLSAAAYVGMSFEENDISEDMPAVDSSLLNLEGAATYGGGCRILDNYTGASDVIDRGIVDCLLNVRRYIGNTWTAPEGNFAAGIGSEYMNHATGVRYSKVAGTGNSGWKPLGYIPRNVPAYGVSVSFDTLGAGGQYDIVATNGSAFAIAAPGTPVSGVRITVRIVNSSGGTLGVVTWNAVFKLATWTSPANGFSRAIDFQYDGSHWVEVSRTPADVPT